MRTLVSMCLAAVAGAAGVAAAAEEAPLVVEARAFEQRLMTALQRADRAVLDAALADGFVFVHSTGPVEARDEYLAHAAGASQLLQRSELSQSDERWRAYGGGTVIRYATVSMRNKATGAETRARNINVYVKTPGKGWQWASGQSTKLPVRPRAAPVDVARVAEYAGRYVIDRERSLVVAREGDTLFGAMTGRSRAELVPTSPTTFLLFNADNDLGPLELTFARDAAGKPVEATLRSNGQLVWRAARAP